MSHGGGGVAVTMPVAAVVVGGSGGRATPVAVAGGRWRVAG
jgi:hypothetical protein